LTRFLLFALALLLILIALFNLGLEIAGMEPDLGPLVGWQHGDRGLPGAAVLATWTLEALALSALFLLVDGRGGSRLLNGLLTGWIAWVFRGPLLVMTAVGYGGLPRGPWWDLTGRWLVLYTLAGLVLGLVALTVRLPRGDEGTASEESPGASSVAASAALPTPARPVAPPAADDPPAQVPSAGEAAPPAAPQTTAPRTTSAPAEEPVSDASPAEEAPAEDDRRGEPGTGDDRRGASAADPEAV
jgi:hypothetical protein